MFDIWWVVKHVAMCVSECVRARGGNNNNNNIKLLCNMVAGCKINMRALYLDHNYIIDIVRY